jgi:hypothetical protein
MRLHCYQIHLVSCLLSSYFDKNLTFILDVACFNTEHIVIFYNSLTGLIPSEIGLMKSLSELHPFFYNSQAQLTHIIPFFSFHRYAGA